MVVSLGLVLCHWPVGEFFIFFIILVKVLQHQLGEDGGS
jgi:hypothetical protein